MFVVRFPQQLDYLTVVGVDFDNGALFTLLVYSPNDRIDLKHNTAHYPKDLIKLLEIEKEQIDSGFYDIRTWQMTLFDQNLKERKDLIKDRGMKKWASFKSIPEQHKMLNQYFKDDKKISKPNLDEYELEQINNHIMQSLEGDIPLILSIYENGYLKACGPGIVAKVDPYQKIVKIKEHNGKINNIQFSKIVGAEII